MTRMIGAVFAVAALLASFAVLSSSIATAAWEKETAWQRAEAAADRKDHRQRPHSTTSRPYAVMRMLSTSSLSF